MSHVFHMPWNQTLFKPKCKRCVFSIRNYSGLKVGMGVDTTEKTNLSPHSTSFSVLLVASLSLTLLCKNFLMSMTTMTTIHQCVVVHIATTLRLAKCVGYYPLINMTCGLQYLAFQLWFCALRVTHGPFAEHVDAPNACEYNLFTSLFGRPMQHWLK